jgi:predicted Zn finger-like uncharacterized protein
MALATRCPHCNTTFRVVHDQLKLRSGMVRCGSCKQVFNGIEHLVRAGPTAVAVTADTAAAPVAPKDLANVAPVDPIWPAAPVATIPPTQPAPIAPDVDASIDHAIDHKIDHKIDHDMDHDIEAPPPSPMASHVPIAPMMPIMPMIIPPEPVHDAGERIEPSFIGPFSSEADAAAWRNGSPDQPPSHLPDTQEPDPLFAEPRDADDVHAEPHEFSVAQAMVQDFPAQAEDTVLSDTEEPSFVKRGRRRQQSGRVWRILTIAASLLLLLALTGQATYIFRNLIAARYPQTKQPLVQACAMLGCRIEFPTQIESLSIESGELQALPHNKNVFSFTTLLRNRSATVQSWPSIELSLTDANEKTLARRVFGPRDYLTAAGDLGKGFAPNSEQPVKLYFALNQLKASGYHVYLFYP